MDRGFKLIARDGYRLPQLTAAWLPEGSDEAALRRALLDGWGIEVGGGLGAFAGKAWRVGLMGHSARSESVERLINAVDALGLNGSLN